MAESFDDMMRREFGDNLDDQPDAAADLWDLCQRYGLSTHAEAAIFICALQVFKAFKRLNNTSGACEDEGNARAGFRRELEALIVRQITLLSQTEH